MKEIWKLNFLFYFLNVWLLSVLRGHSFFSSAPQRPMYSDFEGFSIPDFIHYIYFPILILDDEPVFPFLMYSAKQGHYWYHFYNVFGMTDPCLGIEPGTSRTRSQHSTTGLSRRRWYSWIPCIFVHIILIETMGMESCTRKNNARFEKTAVVNAFSLERAMILSTSYPNFVHIIKSCLQHKC